mgnify:CR=1 FL=1
MTDLNREIPKLKINRVDDSLWNGTLKTPNLDKLDQRFVEEWSKNLPKVGIEEAKTPMIRAGKTSAYANYFLRDKLMELLVFLRDPMNVVVIRDPRDFDRFKELEKNAIDSIAEMVTLLSTKW